MRTAPNHICYRPTVEKPVGRLVIGGAGLRRLLPIAPEMIISMRHIRARAEFRFSAPLNCKRSPNDESASQPVSALDERCPILFQSCSGGHCAHSRRMLHFWGARLDKGSLLTWYCRRLLHLRITRWLSLHCSAPPRCACGAPRPSRPSQPGAPGPRPERLPERPA